MAYQDTLSNRFQALQRDSAGTGNGAAQNRRPPIYISKEKAKPGRRTPVVVKQAEYSTDEWLA